MSFGLTSKENSFQNNARLQSLMNRFERAQIDFGLRRLALSYEENLQLIKPPNELERQKIFFEQLRVDLDEILDLQLNMEDLLEYQILYYEVDRNLERIALSLETWANGKKPGKKGIYHEYNGKAWYQYFVKSWTSTNMTPEEISMYGENEVVRITSILDSIAPYITKRIPYYTYDDAEINGSFVEVKAYVDSQLDLYFPDFHELPNLKIRAGDNPRLANVPGYYNNNTFNYNIGNRPFDLSQRIWLLLHEGSPGHHFQLNYESLIKVPSYRNYTSYSGFREGWAAYVEELGVDLGWYATAEEYRSRLEWDLIRSLRLVLDVGINLKGWSNDKALQEWKKHIKNKDDIAMREIKRMRRWPAQVLTYKIGAKYLMDQMQAEKKLSRKDFTLKSFHTTLLSQRSIPVMLIGLLFR